MKLLMHLNVLFSVCILNIQIDFIWFKNVSRWFYSWFSVWLYVVFARWVRRLDFNENIFFIFKDVVKNDHSGTGKDLQNGREYIPLDSGFDIFPYVKVSLIFLNKNFEKCFKYRRL